MKLYKKGATAFVAFKGQYYTKDIQDWDAFLNRQNLYSLIVSELADWAVADASFLTIKTWDPPMGNQEIWAAGVTYERSKAARMDEAKASGGAVFYDKVYDAERPELFFKATAQRCVGSGDEVYIRKDSDWNVPEPELTLLVSTEGTIEGYTAGNDMSSRQIEGENPLYLPQAKMYERCAAMGPCLYITENPIPQDTQIAIKIMRNGQVMYNEAVTISKIKRSFTVLVDYLFRECDFPKGVFLMTGTCLVPPDNFTLQLQDQISITIDHIGELVGTVGQKK